MYSMYSLDGNKIIRNKHEQYFYIGKNSDHIHYDNDNCRLQYERCELSVAVFDSRFSVNL